MKSITIATSAPDLLLLCQQVCEKLGKNVVKKRLGISIQALNRTLEENPDPWYRLQRRLEIVALCFEVKAGPLFTVNVDEDLAKSILKTQESS